jgi:hypothetical protein
VPLIERHPVRFWQTVSAVLALTVLGLGRPAARRLRAAAAHGKHREPEACCKPSGARFLVLRGHTSGFPFTFVRGCTRCRFIH